MQKQKINSGLVLEATSPEVSSYETSKDEDPELSGSDNGQEKRRKKIIRTLPLSRRSEELKAILQSLDRKSFRRKSEKARAMVLQREEGEPIICTPPDGMPAWATKSQ